MLLKIQVLWDVIWCQLANSSIFKDSIPRRVTLLGFDWLIAFGYVTSQPRCTQALLTGPLCPISKSREPFSPAEAPDGPQAYTLNNPVPKKRNPDTCVWVRPRPHIHIECELRFPLLLHTSYTVDWLAALTSRAIFSGCYVQWEGQLQPWTDSYWRTIILGWYPDKVPRLILVPALGYYVCVCVCMYVYVHVPSFYIWNIWQVSTKLIIN